MDFVCRKLGELKGTESKVDSTRRLENLKEKYDDLMVKTVKLERQLKISEDYEKATDLLFELGIKNDLSNADELIPKFMSSWKGDEGFMHRYLNLVELARDKWRALHDLTEMRRGSVQPEQAQHTTPTIEPIDTEAGKVQKQLPVPASAVPEEGREEDAEEDADLAEEDDDEGEDPESEEEFEEEGFESEPGKPMVTVLTEEKEEPPGECRAIVPVSSEGDKNDD